MSAPLFCPQAYALDNAQDVQRVAVEANTKRARNILRQRRLRAERPDLNREKNARWKAANREKYLAHKAVENALFLKRLVRLPCERCGADDLVHAHHDDYRQRLSVRWLCPMHHRERHREMEAAANG